MANYYNKRVKPKSFQVGDLVLRSSAINRPPSELKKLSLVWKGLYVMIEVVGKEAYMLA